MFFYPWFYSEKEPKVKSGDFYTAEWWRDKAGFETKQKAAARLTFLANKGIVEKVFISEYEIVRFKPTATFCENDIVKMLKETQLVKNLQKNS